MRVPKCPAQEGSNELEISPCPVMSFIFLYLTGWTMLTFRTSSTTEQSCWRRPGVCFLQIKQWRVRCEQLENKKITYGGNKEPLTRTPSLSNNARVWVLLSQKGCKSCGNAEFLVSSCPSAMGKHRTRIYQSFHYACPMLCFLPQFIHNCNRISTPKDKMQILFNFTALAQVKTTKKIYFSQATTQQRRLGTGPAVFKYFPVHRDLLILYF